MEKKDKDCQCNGCDTVNCKEKPMFSLLLSSGEEIFKCDEITGCYCRYFNELYEVYSCNCNKLKK